MKILKKGFNKCLFLFCMQEFQEISKNRPKSQMDHAQWLLDYFFEHATEENVCHLICGKEVCEKCWRYRILKWEKEGEEIWYFTLCFKFILLISEVFACNNNLTLFCNNPFYRQNKGNPINQSYIRWITR